MTTYEFDQSLTASGDCNPSQLHMEVLSWPGNCAGVSFVPPKIYIYLGDPAPSEQDVRTVVEAHDGTNPANQMSVPI